jgi:hypothetical protein
MNLRHRKALKVVAAFLMFAVVQVFVQVGLADPNAPAVTPLPQQFIARLTTRANQPISVNGNSASTGASILTGALIETGPDTGATINLGPLGTLDMAPNSSLRLEYDDQGNVKVTLITGCMILTTRRNASGEVETEQGTAAKTDRGAGGVVDICFPSGATAPTVNQGAAAAAGAGAGAKGGGISATTAAILAGVGAGIVGPILVAGGNPSVSTPNPSLSSAD